MQQQKPDMATNDKTGPSNDDLQTDQWGCTYLKVENLSYKWTIINFSFCTNSTFSPAFSVRPCDTWQWRLELWTSNSSSHGLQQNIALRSIGGVKTDVRATWKCCIIDSKSRKVIETKIDKAHACSKGESYLSNICPLVNQNVLLDTKDGLLPNDTLTILCELKYSTETLNIQGPTTSIKAECRLNHDLEILFKTETLSDVELVVGDQVLRAHKAILAVRSPVFLAMFQNNMKERNQNRVNITDIDCEVLREMLRFIYTGEVKDLKNMASELLKVADKYAIEDLKVTCEEALYSNLDVENAVDTMILADKYGAKQLKAEVVKFVNARGREMMRNARFRSELASLEGIMADVAIERFLALLEGARNEHFSMK